MSLLSRVTNLLLEKNISIKQAERECGISNGSIRRWDTSSPSIDNLIKLADFLEISIDFLLADNRKFTTETQKNVLSANELILTTLFNKIDCRDQNEILDIIKLKYERSIKEKGTQKNSDTEQNPMSPLSLQNNKAIKDTILNVNKTITENSLKEQKPTKSIAYIARNGSRGILELTEEEAEKLKNLKSDDLDF